MTSLEALQQHQLICDELYALSLEENRFLQRHQRAPGADLARRKQGLLERLEAALGALRTVPPGEPRGPEFRVALESARSRILQVLQLDRENEQLLTRYSLSGGGKAFDGPAVPAGMLQKIYERAAR
jgi:hypothetical protein